MNIIKKCILLFFLAGNIFILCSCGNNNHENNNQKSADYTANKTSQQITKPTTEPSNDSQSEQQTSEQSKKQENQPSPQPTETIACEFSTPIKTKSNNRANNIKITCSKINATEVQPGAEFSFCDTTGVSKESEGYKKADVIVGDKIIQALGGGNCQVSTTLYNAVLQLPELQVTERHPHGKKINYVPEGKDAAIAHGSKDFRFKNNSDKALKIYASTDGSTVLIKLAFIQPI